MERLTEVICILHTRMNCTSQPLQLKCHEIHDTHVLYQTVNTVHMSRQARQKVLFMSHEVRFWSAFRVHIYSLSLSSSVQSHKASAASAWRNRAHFFRAMIAVMKIVGPKIILKATAALCWKGKSNRRLPYLSTADTAKNKTHQSKMMKSSPLCLNVLLTITNCAIKLSSLLPLYSQNTKSLEAEEQLQKRLDTRTSSPPRPTLYADIESHSSRLGVYKSQSVMSKSLLLCNDYLNVRSRFVWIKSNLQSDLISLNMTVLLLAARCGCQWVIQTSLISMIGECFGMWKDQLLTG